MSYRIKTYESAFEPGLYVALVEWKHVPGQPSGLQDIKFGFTSLKEARQWGNKRKKELES